MPVLDWIGKDKVVNHHLDVLFYVLKRQYSYDKEGKHAEDNGSENMIIHGDNLTALKSLLPKYEGKINCIYIDPPYNTGKEGWIYNDNVNDPQIKKWLGSVVGKESEDLSRHDKWLCMMYPRLRLLQKLLSDDGAIFISIDDNEQANLKLICDEIFGRNNFISSLPWQSRQSLQNDTDLSINHEFILVYAKQRRKAERRLKEKNKDVWHVLPGFVFLPIPIDQSKFSNPNNDHRGPWKTDPFDAPAVRENLSYVIENPNTGKKYLPPKGRHWRMLEEKYIAALNDDRIVFGKNGKGKPQLKVFLYEQESYGTVPNSWFDGDIYGTATKGTKQLQKIFNTRNTFDTPKPTELLSSLFSIATKKNAIVLDSFAGSGTTAHAVLNLNKQDGGNRKFILVELMDYAESITAERVKRVIDGYGEGKNAVEGTGGDFSFYELGEPLMKDGALNESVGADKIREYVYYTETKQELEDKADEPFYLGTAFDTAYYFYYEPDDVTTLDNAFLQSIKTEAEHFVIYADRCILSRAELEKYGVTFKKIPRDVAVI